MQAYIEIEHSELFLKHFFGANQGGIVASGYTGGVIRISLAVSVDTHDAASGSKYRTCRTDDGKRAYIFDVTNGVDTHSIYVTHDNVKSISVAVTEA